jgi:hydroxymethylglutaryl-CoA reductase (NADPH)
MDKMLGASLLPARWRSAEDNQEHRKPTWLSKHLNPHLTALSKRATVHPIYTIVLVAVLASTTYLGLLESSLFDRQAPSQGVGGHVDFDTLVAGSKKLYTNADNGWKWAIEENGSSRLVDDVSSPHQGVYISRPTNDHRTSPS